MKCRYLCLGPALIIVSLWLGFAPTAAAQSNGVLWEVYGSIPGSAVSDLTNNAAFPDNPTAVDVLPNFEGPTNVAEDYGQRLRAYLVPPTNGNYIFWIASDDNSVLYLSTDRTPTRKRVIASVPGWTDSRQWTWFAEQTSVSIALVAGQRYYLEALMKEGWGGDNLAVRWQLPGGAIEEPIPNNRLIVFGMEPPQIIQQPASATVVEGGNALFSVRLSSTLGASYQWQRQGVGIPGATTSSYALSSVAVSDHGAQFRCFITNPQGSTNSSVALLTVLSDTTAPSILSVGTLGDDTLVTVLFSEPLDAASATNRSNYIINNGITVTGASFGGDTQSVVLRTSRMNAGVIYLLTVNEVRDRAASPNTIAPNTQRTFSIDYTPGDIASLAPGREPIGPSSRRTGLVISEIMYHPTNQPDGKILEFVELFNSQAWAENLGGFSLTGEINYTFPTNTILAAGGYLVVAPVPADVQSVYGITGVLGGFSNRLSNTSGTVRLRNRFGAVLLEANYSGDSPWPQAADGAGHSLVLARPSYGEASPEAWAASDLVGGTPGTAEILTANPYRSIVINEFLAHTDEPDVDYIELYNYGAANIYLAGCTLSDDPETNKCVLASGIIPAQGFLAIYQTELGFSLNAAGETLYLKNPAGNRIIDAVRFGGQQNGIATGRYPDGAPGVYRLQTKSPGTANGRIRTSEIVVNEVMYNPLSGSSDDEYIELWNRGLNAVNLGGWKLSDAISYTFPTNAVLPAGGYLVVGNRVARLLTNYPSLAPGRVWGNYGGKLGNGERIVLTMPDQVVSTNDHGAVVTNTIHIAVDEVAFRKGGRWGKWSDGGGSSLELMDAHSDHRFAANWADSDESNKSGWTTVEYTGLLDNGNGAADTLQIFLQGAGECLVDDVEVFESGGANRVANPDFEGGFGGWFPQGTHDASYWQASGGSGGSKCLHLVASGRGDTGANRVRATLTSALTPGVTATIRAKVRWLKGNPEILLRLHGNWLEAFANIVTTHNLGTPGQANNRATGNVGPAIHRVVHDPLLPAASQSVTIRAQVSDPDGLGSLVLNYRVDPATNFIAVSMEYNGAGLYSATLPGRPAGTLVAFHIQAADAASPSARSLFPSEVPTQECLVRFGESLPSTGRIGTYRFWITQATNARWTQRERNSNKALDATFVYNNSRVVYNVGALYSGSPWHTPGFNGPLNNICDYVLACPKDDEVLGTTDFILSSLGNLNNDDTAQREQAAFWMLSEMGVPTLYRRHINLFVNGIKRGLLYEDAQQPSGEVVKQWFPDDSEGDLHKIEDWFEFDTSGDNQLFNVDATLENFTTTGNAKKLARYRWNWRKRAVNDSANDYAELFGLVDALNSAPPEPYSSQVQRLIDFEEWVRVMAVEHSVGNWDSYGFGRGKNLYAYKPTAGKWSLLPWDIDFVLDNGGDDPSSDLKPGSMQIGDGVARTLLTFPPVQRAWWRALRDLANGPLSSVKISAMMSAKYNGLLSAGIPVTTPTGALNYVGTRRSAILAQLAQVAAPFALTSGSYSTNQNFVTLSGTAPIEVSTILINGVSYPVTWTSVTNWSIRLALGGGANPLAIVGQDRLGNVVPGTTTNLTITYTGATELPQDRLVINEIMYNPAAPDAAFVEIHNTSAINAFDLGGWRLEGADFIFPGGTLIAPGGFLVIAGNADGFTAAYGTGIPLAGVFNGKLQNTGETLRLVKPGSSPELDIIVDEVTYEGAAPWPGAANGFGSSLQLVDPYQDNNRVMNWTAVTTNVVVPQWQYVKATGTASTSRLYVYLGAGGSIYLDDLKLVAGAVAEVGQNYIKNGDFESALTGPWITTANTASSVRSTALAHAGSASLKLVCNAAGTGQDNSLRQENLGLTTNAQYTLSFWFLQTTNAGTLTLRLSGNGIRVDQNTQMPGAMPLARSTPGQTNSVFARLAAFPPVRLNEVQPNNASGLRDNFNERDSWLELYNAGSAASDLSGFYLSDTSSNLTKWQFPAGSAVSAGGFRLVWLDNQPAQTSGTNWHANFKANPTNGVVFLSTVSGSNTNVIDYLRYGSVNNDRSYGAYPDGISGQPRTFFYATPNAANSNSWPAVPVLINEWMASNTRTLFNAAIEKYSDWFELFNAGPVAVDLSGYYLANSLSTPKQFKIPSGYVVPSHGFLLVWADDEANENSAAEPALHAGFKLSASGETIALFTPVGALIDTVAFTQQTNDISQGRWPDGNSGQYYFMSTPTPWAENILGVPTNSPPTMVAIPDQTAYQGTPLAFTVFASDPDAGQTLAYSLDAGAPLGAYINPSSGVFSWTPTQANPPGVYAVTVRATDDGSPGLSDARTAAITVLVPAPLAIGPVRLSPGGGLVLTWATQPGKVYRVEYKSSLSDLAWTTLSELTATGTELSVEDETTALTPRFYRIMLLD